MNETDVHFSRWMVGRFNRFQFEQLLQHVCFLFQVDLKPLREATIAVPTPKISEKRKAEEADASKDLKKVSMPRIWY